MRRWFVVWVFAVYLLVPSVAFGWAVTFDEDGTTYTIERAAADAAGTVYVYGSTSPPSVAYMASGSWCGTGTGTPFSTLIQTVLFTDAARVFRLSSANYTDKLVCTPGGERWLSYSPVRSLTAYVSNSALGMRAVAGSTATLPVSWDTSEVVSILGTVPVSGVGTSTGSSGASGSASFEGTLPVSIAGFPGFDGLDLQVALGGLAFLGGVFCGRAVLA